ncbi:MAG TPA: hypothetical protein PLI09_08125 [Candidatus Hydrogenedentes bacterium]|nr:hypothetical protein [Candidatus Hydrogenedentota bacterium]
MKKNLFTLLMAQTALCIAILCALCGCPTPPVDGVKLTVLTSPAAGGTAQATPSQDLYASGTVVNITAAPADGWRFNRWVGLAANPNLSATTITLDRSETVTAVFEPILQNGYTLKVDVAPSSGLAYVTMDPPPDPVTNVYRPGAVVTLTADTKCCSNGGDFVRWEGAVINPDDPVTAIIMDSNQMVRAVVRPTGAPDYQVTVSALPEDAGTVQIVPNQNVFFAGEEGTVEATPNSGYKFAFWIGDVSNIISSTTTFTATKDASLIAFFKPESGTSENPHAYLFGIPDGPLAEQITEQFPNVVTEIGTEVRGLVMPGSAIDIVHNEASHADGLKRVFDAGYPVILTAVTVPQIVVLEEIIGVEPGGIELEPGEDFLAYFGIDLEPDGKVWRLAGHMPKPGDTDELPQDDAWRAQCIASAEAWLLKDNHRAEEFPGVDVAAETVVKTGYEDLVTLAKVDPLQVYYFYTFTDTNASDAFVLTTFAYSCHSMTGSGIDYFYVVQYGTFSGSGSYKYTDCSHNGGFGSAACDSARYDYQYSMYTQIPGLNVGDSNVTIYSPSPVTYSGANPTVTSGVTWSLGGSVGVNTAQGPTFSITSGVQVTNSYTISIPDVSIVEQITGFNEPHWTYNIRRAYEHNDDMSGPPLIAQGTFAPTNQWLYYIQPAVRTTFPNGLPLKVSFTALQASDSIDCDVASNYITYCTWHSSTSKTMTASQTFTVPWPPNAP